MTEHPSLTRQKQPEKQQIQEEKLDIELQLARAEQKISEMVEGQKIINQRIRGFNERLDALEELEREALELLIKRLKSV